MACLREKVEDRALYHPIIGHTGENQVLTYYAQKNQNLQHFLDFLILFVTEALLYCGIAIFLLIIDHARSYVAFNGRNAHGHVSPFGQRISSVATSYFPSNPYGDHGLCEACTGRAAFAALAP